MRIWIVLLSCLFALPVIAQTALVDDATDTSYLVEEYVTANFPVGMVFAPDGRLFYNEKTTGSVRVVSPDGVLQPDPIITLPTSALQERGMLGLALSPTFAADQLMYVVHTAQGTTRDFPANRLVRFTVDATNIAGEVQELWRLPIENGLLLHNGGNVHFDAEGYLHLSVGDYGEAANAQDLNTAPGAIHRFAVTDEGLAPAPDNPFADSSIYAYGLRNSFDFTFDPITNNLFATESGPNCDDEINLILPGFNYGWGEDYECVGTQIITGLTLYAPPLLTYQPTIAPTGIAIYDGEAFPAWQGDLFFCDWNFGELHRVVLDESRTRALSDEVLDLGAASCRIDLIIGPDGAFYFGTVGEGGGTIWRLRPST